MSLSSFRKSRSYLLLLTLVGTAHSMPSPTQDPPSRAELEPIRHALHGFRDATAYVVGIPPQPPPVQLLPDSAGRVAGCPIIASAHMDRRSWFDSLAVILADTATYDRRDRLCILLGPDYIVRIRGDRDSVTVMAAWDCAFLSVATGSGSVVAGWLDDRRRRQIQTLLDLALADAMAHANAPPTRISSPIPFEPDSAANPHSNGDVLLRVLVGADGKVKSVKVLRSRGSLDRVAMDAVEAWTFNPARKNGTPVASWLDVPVNIGR
jgi:TonB family protein